MYRPLGAKRLFRIPNRGHGKNTLPLLPPDKKCAFVLRNPYRRTHLRCANTGEHDSHVAVKKCARSHLKLHNAHIATTVSFQNAAGVILRHATAHTCNRHASMIQANSIGLVTLSRDRRRGVVSKSEAKGIRARFQVHFSPCRCTERSSLHEKLCFGKFPK